MKALVYPAWDTIEIRDVPPPRAAPGEVVLRVAAVGICGSEVEAVASRSPRRPPPLVMGHEFCGEVETVGDEVSDVKPGDRVVASSLVTCGRCVECRAGASHLCPRRQVFGMNRPGAFAEYVAVPASVLFPLPERVSPIQGALVEPLGNAVHVWSLIAARFPETVVVLGCGTIGLMALQVAKAGGALRLVGVDTNESRLELAHAVGAEPLFNPVRHDVVAEVRQFTRGRGADVVIDAVGSPATRKAAVEAARPGGEIVWIGLHGDVGEISGRDVVLGERHITGSYAVRPVDIDKAIALFAHGKVEVEPWVRLFDLDEGPRVFRALLTAPPPRVREGAAAAVSGVCLAEDVVDADRDVGKRLRAQCVSALRASGATILRPRGLSADLDRLAFEIDDPEFGDCCARVEASLDTSIIIERRLGHLDNQQHIVGAGMRTAVEIRSRRQERDIWLWLGVGWDPRRVLCPDDCPIADSSHEQARETRHARCMTRADRGHLDDLSVDELDAVVLREDAGLTHAVVFVESEPAAKNFRSHDQPPLQL